MLIPCPIAPLLPLTLCREMNVPPRINIVSPGFASEEALEKVLYGVTIVPFPVVSFPETDTNMPA